MTKIDIISGFLGAGKTTLIKKLIAEAFQGQQIVLIENEFGEIGIDGGFLKDSGVQISEMNSGCICCSLVGDFGTALREVLEKFHPDRIVIEPSGVGKLSDVIKAVQRVAADTPMELNSFVTVADAGKCKMYMKNFGEFYNNQVESANAIILSRTQNVSQEKLEAAVALLREHNSSVAIITTPWDQLTGRQILKAMEAGGAMIHELIDDDDDDDGDDDDDDCCHEHHHDHDGHGHHHDHDHDEHGHHHDHDHDEHGHHHHHADEVFTSWGVETPKKFTKEAIHAVLDALDAGGYGNILRAKGIVPAEDGSWIHFDFTPGEQDIRTGAADYTGRLCVIGAELKEEKLPGLFGL